MSLRQWPRVSRGQGHECNRHRFCVYVVFFPISHLVSSRSVSVKRLTQSPHLSLSSLSHLGTTLELARRPSAYVTMLSLSISHFSLLGVFRSPLLELWLKARDHATLSAGLALGLIILYIVHYLTSPYRNLPPGPRGYPIIGNALEFGEGPWLYFTELQKKYGQFIISIFLFPPIFEVCSTIGR